MVKDLEKLESAYKIMYVMERLIDIKDMCSKTERCKDCPLAIPEADDFYECILKKPYFDYYPNNWQLDTALNDLLSFRTKELLSND